MVLVIDSARGRKVGEHLYNAFSTIGVHGRKDMPEDIVPNSLKRGSVEHALFITLTVAIDYQRDAPSLWESSRKTYDDPETRYLFNPGLLYEFSFKKIVEDMQKYKLSKKPEKDANIWRTVGVTFYKKWQSKTMKFIDDCKWDSIIILNRLKNDTHVYRGRIFNDYPYLRGPKIGPLWLRMMRDNVGVTGLKRLEEVPIPVDIHVARATVATGVVRGQFKGRLGELFENIREAWFKSLVGLNALNRAMIALDVDEPLWRLSKYGCTKRDKISGNCPAYYSCEAKEFCIKGNIRIEKSVVDLET